MQVVGKVAAENEAQIRRLHAKIEQLEHRLREREEEYSRLQASSSARDRVRLVRSPAYLSSMDRSGFRIRLGFDVLTRALNCSRAGRRHGPSRLGRAAIGP